MDRIILKYFWTFPNCLSLLRMTAGAPSVIMVYLFAGPVSAASVFVFFMLTDLEGVIARRFKSESEWGAVLDPWADTAFVLTLLWFFYFEGMINYLGPMILSVREIAVFAMRVIAAKNGTDVRARFVGKLKVTFEYALIFCLLLGGEYYFFALLFFYPAIFFSYVALIRYLWCYTRRSVCA